MPNFDVPFRLYYGGFWNGVVTAHLNVTIGAGNAYVTVNNATFSYDPEPATMIGAGFVDAFFFARSDDLPNESRSTSVQPENWSQTVSSLNNYINSSAGLITGFAHHNQTDQSTQLAYRNLFPYTVQRDSGGNFPLMSGWKRWRDNAAGQVVFSPAGEYNINLPPELLTYKPMAIRRSGWQSLNRDSGFIRRRIGGSWADRSDESYETVMVANTGHNRIRNGGQFKQLPPM